MSTHFIVGGSSGIGLSLTKILAAEGHRVFATYRTTQPAQISNVSFHHYDARAETIDLSFLPETIDSVVYCPGSILLKPFHRITAEDFKNDYDLQVAGAVKTIQSVLPALKKGNNASIVFFSTVAASLGLNFHSLVSTNKAALEGLTKALAAELAPIVRVNCIAPSLTDTPLAATLLSTHEKRESNAQRHPLKKIGEADDIANMAAFLLSEKAKWITGQIMHVDGGMSSIKL